MRAALVGMAALMMASLGFIARDMTFDHSKGRGALAAPAVEAIADPNAGDKLVRRSIVDMQRTAREVIDALIDLRSRRPEYSDQVANVIESIRDRVR